MITIAQARVAKSSASDVFVHGDPGIVTDIIEDQDNPHGWVVVVELKGWRAELEPDHVQPSTNLLDLMESGTYDAAGYAEGEKSPEQVKIYEQAEDLIELLRQVVPDSTIHWAVEDARRALRDLSREAGKILTHDRRPPVEGDDEGYMPAERQLLP